MREHSSKIVNVLGIDVSGLRPEKAVNLSVDYMKKKGLETVFFLSAESSLFCQNHPWATEVVSSCPLVLPGDRAMESAVFHDNSPQTGREGIGVYAEEYLKRLLVKLNKEKREIYAIMDKQEKIDSLQEYVNQSYPDIMVKGIVFEGESDGEQGKVVNEINANIPDVVFICLPVEQQITFARDNAAMMNTRLCICIESIQPLIQKETGNVPSPIQFLHLDGFWYHLQNESIIRKTIVNSIFRKRVLSDAAENDSQKLQQESAAEPGYNDSGENRSAFFGKNDSSNIDNNLKND